MHEIKLQKRYKFEGDIFKILVENADILLKQQHHC